MSKQQRPTARPQWAINLSAEGEHISNEELGWYASSIEHSGEPSRAQVEAARRFLVHWLNEDSHELTIPDSEWGRSLLHWLRILAANSTSELSTVDANRGAAASVELLEARVEAAAREYHERHNGSGAFDTLSDHVRTSLLFRMRCALRAADNR